MTFAAAIFIVLQLLSLTATVVMLAEFRRLTREHDGFIADISGKKPQRHIRAMAAAYLVTTLVLLGTSWYLLFR